MTTIFKTPNELLNNIGKHLGYSDWLLIDQNRINLFADATGDHQWIHVDPVKAKDGPFGACILNYIVFLIIKLNKSNKSISSIR